MAFRRRRRSLRRSFRSSRRRPVSRRRTRAPRIGFRM